MSQPDLREDQFANAFVRIATSDGPVAQTGTSNRRGRAIISALAVIVTILLSHSPHGRTAASLGDTPHDVPQETLDMNSGRTSMLALSASLVTAPSIASTIRVPADQSTIQAAVNVAVNGDVIELTGGVFTENVVIAGKQVIIQRAAGAECVLNASHFSVSASTTPGVSFRGIRFTGSTGSALGAAVEAQDSDIGFTDCEFVGNSISGGSGSYGGAALYARNCRLMMRSTAVNDNSVTLVSGGYPFAFGGAVLAYQCTVDIRDCSFARNTCSATVPGASWAEAKSYGGAIFMRSGTGVIGNCRFDANAVRSEVHGLGPLAGAFGGAIDASGTPGTGLVIQSCTFTNNRATAISDNSYYGGGGGANGGAVCFGPDQSESGVHAVRDCLFFESRSDKSPSTNGQSVSDIAFIGADSGSVERCHFGASSTSALTGDAIVGAVVAWGGTQSSLSSSDFCGLNCVSSAMNVHAKDVSVAASCGDCNDNGTPDLAEIIDGAPDNDADGIPDACQCTSDLNRDRLVNGSDMGIILGFWGPTGSVFPQSDINRDGSVDGADIGLLLANWGPCPH